MGSSEPQVHYYCNHRLIAVTSAYEQTSRMVEEHDGNRLERLMKRAGVTKAELARHIGTSPTGVKKWIDTGSIAREHIAPMCRFLRCSADELLGLDSIANAASPHVRPNETTLASALQTVDEVLQEFAIDYPPEKKAKLVAGCYLALLEGSAAAVAKTFVQNIMESLRKSN